MDLTQQYESIQPRYPELEGKVALVTGSSRHIGKGIAFRLAKEGMKVVINSRSTEAVEQATAELHELGAEAIAVPGDIGQEADIERLFDQTLEAFGTVDLLVNNAADLRRVHFLEGAEQYLEGQLASNIKGPYLCSLRAARIMGENGGGNIIHVSTVGALRAHWPGLPNDMTKGAVDAMTRCMALDLADSNIRVNCIAPGPIWRVARSEYPNAEETLDRVPMRKPGTALDIAATVAFLASPDAGYITGQVIYVDGGLTVQLTPRGQPI